MWIGYNAQKRNRQKSLIYKKLRYRRGTARCVVSVEILPIATHNGAENTCTTSPEQIEIMKLEGYSWPMCNEHVHSTMTRSSRFHCPVADINKPTTDKLWISPVYRRLAVAKFSKSTWPWPHPFQERFFIRGVGLAMVNQCTKFEVSRFTRYEAMNGGAKCRKWGG